MGRSARDGGRNEPIPHHQTPLPRPRPPIDVTGLLLYAWRTWCIHDTCGIAIYLEDIRGEIPKSETEESDIRNLLEIGNIAKCKILEG